MDKIKIYFLPFIIGAFVAYLITYASAQETQRQMEWLKYVQLQNETQFQIEFIKKDINRYMEEFRQQLDGLYHEMDMLRRDSGNIGD